MTHIHCILILLVLLLSAGCKEQDVQHMPSGKTVKVGIIAPMSGDDKLWGTNGLLGAEIALQLEPYLVNGDKVEFVVEDDRNTPHFAAAAALKFADDEDVAALLLFSGSAAALAVADIADILEIPVLAVTSSHPQVTENEWISQLVFDDGTQGIVSALYVMDELLVDRVTVFKDLQDPHSVYLAEEFARKFTESGGTVEEVTLGAGQIDYEGIVGRFGVARSPFLYLPLNADHVLAVEAAARKLDKNFQIMVSDGVLGLVVLNYEKDKKLLDGILAVDVYSTTLSRTDFGKRVAEKYTNNFNEPGTTISALGCEGMSLLFEAMGRCADSTNRECVNDKLRGGMEFEGFFGKIRIRSDGKIERPVFINLIKNGQVKNLVKIY